MAFQHPETFGVLEKCFFSIPNGGDRHIKVATKMVAEGTKKGVSDTMLAVPRGKYCGLFIEMKKPGGRESADQKKFGAAVQDQHYCYAVCDHWALATHLIMWYLTGCEGPMPDTILGA